MTSVMTRYLYV